MTHALHCQWRIFHFHCINTCLYCTSLYNLGTSLHVSFYQPLGGNVCFGGAKKASISITCVWSLIFSWPACWQLYFILRRVMRLLLLPAPAKLISLTYPCTIDFFLCLIWAHNAHTRTTRAFWCLKDFGLFCYEIHCIHIWQRGWRSAKGGAIFLAASDVVFFLFTGWTSFLPALPLYFQQQCGRTHGPLVFPCPAASCCREGEVLWHDDYVCFAMVTGDWETEHFIHPRHQTHSCKSVSYRRTPSNAWGQIKQSHI